MTVRCPAMRARRAVHQPVPPAISNTSPVAPKVSSAAATCATCRSHSADMSEPRSIAAAPLPPLVVLLRTSSVVGPLLGEKIILVHQGQSHSISTQSNRTRGQAEYRSTPRSAAPRPSRRSGRWLNHLAVGLLSAPALRRNTTECPRAAEEAGRGLGSPAKHRCPTCAQQRRPSAKKGVSGTGL